jgi:hypothetical protein
MLKTNKKYTHHVPKSQGGTREIELRVITAIGLHPNGEIPTLFLMRPLLLSMFFALAAGCNPVAPPNDLVSEEKFAVVYAELTDAGEQGKATGHTRAQARQRADSVLQASGVSREQFLAMTAWLNKDVSRWRNVTEEVARILEARAIRNGTPR